MAEKFWLDDPAVLMNYRKCIPTRNMTHIEMMNSLIRFCLYVSILYVLFTRNLSYIIIPIAIIVIITAITTSKEQPRESFEVIDDIVEEACQLPSRDNPFMNVTLTDIIDNPTRPPACPIDSCRVNEMIDQAVDAIDEYGGRFLQRQFYTMPATTIPNDQTGFAEWLYATTPTCKEDNAQCMKYNYEDIRYNRYNPVVDDSY